MPNFNTDLYNSIIDHAEGLYSFLSGSYMDGFENRLLDCGDEGVKIGPMQFTRVLQYRKSEDNYSNLKTVQSAMSACLGFCAHSDAAFGYFLVSDGGEYSLYLAIEEQPAERISKLLEGSIPDISFRGGFIPSPEVVRLAPHAGIISGDIHCNGLAVDMLLQAFNGIDGILGIVAVPMEQKEVSCYADALDAVRQRTSKLLNNDMTYASQVRKINQRSYRFVPELDERLKMMSDYYRSANEDYWKSCIWIGCTDTDALRILGGSAAGTLNGTNDGFDKARFFFTTDSPLKRGELYLPTALFGSHQYIGERALLKPSLISYASTTHIASVIQLPSSQVRGIDVIELSRTSESLRLFDVNRNGRTDGVVMGKIAGSGTDYAVSLGNLTGHVLVTGATGTGKTNTVFNLVRGIHANKIPCLIIEPSKKDYWILGSEFRDMRIYSFGSDAELLRINPLMPEEGVIIANHIDSLLYAFSGAFEMEEPTRLALDGLIKFAYERFGWRDSDIAFCSGKPFPKIRDLLDLVPEYCATRLPYGDEVRSNIHGSLVNRLSSLNSGPMSESLNSLKPVTGSELCRGSVLIELDDLSLETKPFVAMLLMIKVDQYLRQNDVSDHLKNTIVLEEAHNIFASVSNSGQHGTSDKASHYFSNMLSQIRGYGAGIIIADQGPSQINDMAISNTKVKVIHGIVNHEDIEKVAFALNLADAQKRVFPSLQSGEAVIAELGSKNVCKVKINRSDIVRPENIACLFCSRKKACSNFNIRTTAPVRRASLYAQRIYEARFNPSEVARELHDAAAYLNWPQSQELCLLGRLLSEASMDCGDREKRRIVHRYLHASKEA